MKKYYMMAIGHNNTSSMYNVACYYSDIEHNEDLAEKYFLMSLEGEYVESTSNLCNYYYKIKNYKKRIMIHKIAANILNNKNTTLLTHIINFYYSNNLYVDLLELFLNYPKTNDEAQIIRMFNNMRPNTLTPKLHTKFLQLLNEYEFNNNDNLNEEIKLLVKN